MIDLDFDPVLKLTYKTLRLRPRAEAGFDELLRLDVFVQTGIARTIGDKLFQRRVFRQRDLADLTTLNDQLRTVLEEEWEVSAHWQEGMAETSYREVPTALGSEVKRHATALFELQDVLEDLLALLEAEDVAMQLRTADTPYK